MGHPEGDRPPQLQENKYITHTIKKLDKTTLNLYTAFRAELGPSEPGSIGFAWSDLRPRGIEWFEALGRTGSHEQDYWN